MSYVKSTPPTLTGTEERKLAALLQWINLELITIEVESKTPEFRGIQFEVLYELPARYKEGDLYYGAAGVFGGQAGLYLREGANWRKL